MKEALCDITLYFDSTLKSNIVLSEVMSEEVKNLSKKLYSQRVSRYPVVITNVKGEFIVLGENMVSNAIMIVNKRT